jgi:hypothetical protein
VHRFRRRIDAKKKLRFVGSLFARPSETSFDVSRAHENIVGHTTVITRDATTTTRNFVS